MNYTKRQRSGTTGENGSQRRRSPVARHSRKYNLAHVMRDRKKAAKRGKTKHRGKTYDY